MSLRALDSELVGWIDSAYPYRPEPFPPPAASFAASILCSRGCGWYHGFRPYLRLFDMAANPSWHSEFYLRGLREGLGPGRPRVLVSGTADHTLLAYVARARLGIGLPAEVTVVDLCDTPLMLCKWWGALNGVGIVVHQGDVRDLTESEPFDLIVADSFLTRFEPKERLRVIDHWWRLLRPGGSILTTIRLEACGGEPVVASEEEAALFCGKVRDYAESLGGMLDRRPDELADGARLYSTRMKSYPFDSQAQVLKLLAENGFRLRYNETALVKGEFKPATYARVAAERQP